MEHYETRLSQMVEKQKVLDEAAKKLYTMSEEREIELKEVRDAWARSEADNEALRAVLDTVVPPECLVGLRAYPHSPGL